MIAAFSDFSVNTGTVYFVLLCFTLLAAVAFLVLGFRSSTYREVLFAASGLIGAASAAFLAEYLTYRDHWQSDRWITWLNLKHYAMTEVLLQYTTVDNLATQLQTLSKDGKPRSEDYLADVNLSPLPVYDDLIRSDRLPMFANPTLFYDLAVIKSSEAYLLQEIFKGHSDQQKAEKVQEYGDLLKSAWIELCLTEESIIKTNDPCKIEVGIAEISTTRQNYKDTALGKLPTAKPKD